MLLNCSALDCEDEPDTGLIAGVESRTWNNLFYYATVITYKCPYGISFNKKFSRTKAENKIYNLGKAFNGTFKKEINSTCGFHNNYKLMVFWNFNSSHPLPKCIRKLVLYL